MRISVLCYIIMLACTTVHAQKKELSQARSYIKSGSYEQAEQLMVQLLKDEANRDNKRIYLTWYTAVMGQYQAANEKLYLKQQYDTAAFFNLTQRMYQITETLDSLESQPDVKGRVRYEYRKGHAETMNQLRPNLYYGGTYNLRRNHYEEAFRFFDLYIDASRQPLFTGYDYEHRDSLMSTAAYWATLCGHRMQSPERTLQYSQLALQDADKAEFVQQYICEAYRQQGNDSAYVAALADGFTNYPDYPYFFPRLADHYSAEGRYDTTLELANQALAELPGKPLFLLAKSVALLNLERYDECREVSEELIAKADTLPEPYFNIATTYLNEALALEQKNEPRRYRSQLTTLYSQARPYMEKYRLLAPDDQRRWAPALYRVYLHLNLGKQFDEIDRLMRQ